MMQQSKSSMFITPPGRSELIKCSQQHSYSEGPTPVSEGGEGDRGLLGALGGAGVGGYVRHQVSPSEPRTRMTVRLDGKLKDLRPYSGSHALARTFGHPFPTHQDLLTPFLVAPAFFSSFTIFHTVWVCLLRHSIRTAMAFLGLSGERSSAPLLKTGPARRNRSVALALRAVTTADPVLPSHLQRDLSVILETGPILGTQGHIAHHMSTPTPTWILAPMFIPADTFQATRQHTRLILLTTIIIIRHLISHAVMPIPVGVTSSATTNESSISFILGQPPGEFVRKLRVI